MAEINVPDCPLHGALPRAIHEHNFEGIVTVIDELLYTVSGVVGTTTYTRCPYGYSYNFEGVVRALEDLNASMSGIQGGGGGGSNVVSGSGIYLTTSGIYDVINADYGVIVSGALVQGDNINFDFLSEGRLEINSTATISGVQSAVYVQDNAPVETNGALWFDTAEGRLLVFAEASGWYQTNAEALAVKGDVPPSGTNLNAPPRDGQIWFNTSMGNLFVYDSTTSGWYETGTSRSFAYGSAAPAPTVPGAGWYDTNSGQIKVWDGTEWTDITISGGSV
jgi:hypothetical protein